MSTFIDGVGQCQVVDKSSELVDLKGHDITSLDKTGTVTWEHQAGTPASLVGKILKAKKIFSKEDCENDRELKYWNKCKEPYLYIMGELLDDYTASAKECAGQMRYSRDNPNQAPLLGFSIEGSEIPNTRKGMIITRSIARKVTLTQSPCNSMCVAEIFESDQKPQIRDDFEEIFKTEANAISLFKSGEGEKIYGDYLAKKEQYQTKPPKSPSNEYDNQGIRPGKTKGGESAFSHGHIAPYKFNPAEHQEGGEFHEHANVTAQNPKLGDNKTGRMKMNSNAVAAGGRKEDRAALSLVDKDKIALEQSKQQMAKGEKLCKAHQNALKKDQYGYPDSPSGSTMSTPPPEPNKANAAAISAGATSGGPSMSQAWSNLTHSLDKSDAPSWSKGKVDHKNAAVHFSHPEHGIVSIQKQPEGAFHVKHRGGMANIGATKGIFSTPQEANSHAKKYMSGLSGSVTIPANKGELKKAIEAGGYNAAPSTLTNGAAYQTESMGSRQANTGTEGHEFQATKKKDWNKQAKEDYERWPHREKFEKFMQARMPHLAMGEIKALGRALSLKKSIEFEKSLDNLIFLKPKK